MPRLNDISHLIPSSAIDITVRSIQDAERDIESAPSEVVEAIANELEWHKLAPYDAYFAHASSPLQVAAALTALGARFEMIDSIGVTYTVWSNRTRSIMCIVHVNDQVVRDFAEYVGTLAHEASHVFDEVIKRTSSDEVPTGEHRAHSIGYILETMWRNSETLSGLVTKETLFDEGHDEGHDEGPDEVPDEDHNKGNSPEYNIQDYSAFPPEPITIMDIPSKKAPKTGGKDTKTVHKGGKKR